MRTYELSSAAEKDLRDIVQYTAERWGTAQVRKYTQTLEQCAAKLAAGQGYYKLVSDLYPNMRVIHCQHHYIFGVMRENAPMLIVAILHERMDIITQLENRLK
ncbi:MAG: type II toxin-antitoxin system RelE/ParE family toxin [Symploca sp. SIO2G7]|nr:type II toxin-antitoxin system RelE/ParE family toxin [Symploca sp. SIO2G7]